jgi:hypothetical protein
LWGWRGAGPGCCRPDAFVRTAAAASAAAAAATAATCPATRDSRRGRHGHVKHGRLADGAGHVERVRSRAAERARRRRGARGQRLGRRRGRGAHGARAPGEWGGRAGRGRAWALLLPLPQRHAPQRSAAHSTPRGRGGDRLARCRELRAVRPGRNWKRARASTGLTWGGARRPAGQRRRAGQPARCTALRPSSRCARPDAPHRRRVQGAGRGACAWGDRAARGVRAARLRPRAQRRVRRGHGCLGSGLVRRERRMVKPAPSGCVFRRHGEPPGCRR